MIRNYNSSTISDSDFANII